MTEFDKYTTDELIHIATNTRNQLALALVVRFEDRIATIRKEKRGLEEVIKKISQEQ